MCVFIHFCLYKEWSVSVHVLARINSRACATSTSLRVFAHSESHMCFSMCLHTLTAERVLPKETTVEGESEDTEGKS